MDQTSICSYTNVLNTLENHIPQCDGEDRAWTVSCFHRTLEEFNVMNTQYTQCTQCTQYKESKPINATSEPVQLATEDIDYQTPNRFSSMCHSVKYTV